MTLYDIAQQVLAGRYGNGSTRRQALADDGYDYDTVQSVVNAIKGGYYDGGTDYEYGTSPESSSESTSQSGPTLTERIIAQQEKVTNPSAKPTYTSEFNNTIKSLATDYINGKGTEGYQKTIDSINNQLNNMSYTDPYANQLNKANKTVDDLGLFETKYDADKERLMKALDTGTYFDLENDPVWKEYQYQYTNQGQKAYENALATLAARTGGIANSYAQSVANQAIGNYMQQMGAKIPELAQLAENRTRNNLNMYRTADSDRMNVWSANRSAAENDVNRYLTMSNKSRSDYEKDRSYLTDDLNRNSTLKDRIRNEQKENMDAMTALENAAYQMYRDQVSDWNTDWTRDKSILDILYNAEDRELAKEAAAQAAAAAASRSSGGGGRVSSGGGDDDPKPKNDEPFITNPQRNGKWDVDGFMLTDEQIAQGLKSGLLTENQAGYGTHIGVSDDVRKGYRTLNL